MPEICANHPQSEATFRCDACGRVLCEWCVNVGKHLIFCGSCGELALPIDADPVPVVEEQDLETAAALLEENPEDLPDDWQPTARETGYRPIAEKDVVDPPSVLAMQGLMQHVVVPAAIIGMLVGFLFFLLCVRSVFFTGSEDLMWRGFWFAVAATLIARYGKMYGGEAVKERQGYYTVALLLATGLIILTAPWAAGNRSFLETAIVAGMALLIWSFAGKLVDALDLDRPRPVRGRLKLFGLERLRHEAWLKSRGRTPPSPGDIASQYSRSSRMIARFGLLAILVFALGEPILLAGPPATGLVALLSMMLFFVAGGILLASGSATGTYQLVRARDGHASLATIASRIGVGALMMTLILVLAASFPTIEYRGVGEIQPEGPGSGNGVRGLSGIRSDGAENGEARGETGQGEDGKGGEERGQKKQGKSGEDSDSGSGRSAADGKSGQGNGSSSGESSSANSGQNSSSNPGSVGQASGGLIRPLLQLGRWLWILVFVAIGLVVLWFLGRYGVGGLRDLGRGFRAWLDSLRSRYRPAGEQERPRRLEDPFADTGAIERLAPSEAIVEAYRRLQVFFDQQGYERPPRQTPHEYLAGLPKRWRTAVEPATALTELYVRAVYSGDPVEPADRRSAVASLLALRRALP